jgi:hypothetical protein
VEWNSEIQRWVQVQLVGETTTQPGTVEPDPSDPTEKAIFSLEYDCDPDFMIGCSNGYQVMWKATFPVRIVHLPPPIIKWEGTIISGTTQSAVVGQKIKLTAQPKSPLPAGYTLTSSTWTVDGTSIGKLHEPASDHGFKTEDTVLDKPDTTFYWLSQGNGLNVSYTYCVTDPSGNQLCPSTTTAKATFSVTGPISATLYTCGGAVTECSMNLPLGNVGITTVSGRKLQFGGSAANIGIAFTASDDSSSPPGMFSFAQVLGNYTTTYTYKSGGSCPFNFGTGLDNIYPLKAPAYPTVDDNPYTRLYADDTEVTAAMQASMYLFWKSSATSDSIPVSLGYVGWAWFGDAVKDKKTRTWSIKPGSGSQGSASSFSESSAYPQWIIVIHNETRNQCAY